MRFLIQLSIIFAVCLAGEFLSGIIPVTVPSSVMSMIILFVLLGCGIIKVYHIQSVSDFLLGHMAFFFVPAGVGLIDSFPQFADKLLPLLAVCTINTLITFIVTAAVVSLLSKRRNRNE